MRIQPQDNLSLRSTYADIQTGGSNALRIVQQLDKGILPTILLDNLAGSVSAHPIHKEHFQFFFRPILRNDRPNALFDAVFFVVYGANDG